MQDDELSTLLDGAFPRCPVCMQQLDDAGAPTRPHLVCRRCGISVIPPS